MTHNSEAITICDENHCEYWCEQDYCNNKTVNGNTLNTIPIPNNCLRLGQHRRRCASISHTTGKRTAGDDNAG